MTALGDIFPDEWKEKLANENLKIGAVIRITVPDTTPPKIKRLVIVGIGDSKEKLISIFINSDINPSILNTPELQQLQHKLEKEKCPFLDHASYADCSKVKERDYSEIHKLLKGDTSTHLGQLNNEDLKAIKALLKSAKTIPVRTKKAYSLFI